MRLWAEALDIAHATRMKLISAEKLCRGVTAIGNPVRGAFEGTSEQPQNVAVRLICQMGLLPRPAARLSAKNQGDSMTDEDQEKTGARFTAQIIVNTKKRRTNLPEFHIESDDETVDVRPLAQAVLAAYPEKVEIDVETLARLCVKQAASKYIRVVEYPVGTDRKVIHELMARMLRWQYWPRRRDQLVKTSRAFPDRQFQCDEKACEAAIVLNGTRVSITGPVRLPLDTCWGRICNCDYSLVKRDGTVF